MSGQSPSVCVEAADLALSQSAGSGLKDAVKGDRFLPVKLLAASSHSCQRHVLPDDNLSIASLRFIHY